MITLKNMLSTSNIQLLKLISIFISALLFSNNLFAQDDLAEFSAQYAVQKSGIKLAEAIYQLSYTDTGYKFTHNSKLHGIAAMFGDDSVSAISYIDKVGGLKSTVTFKQVEKKTRMRIFLFNGIPPVKLLKEELQVW